MAKGTWRNEGRDESQISTFICGTIAYLNKIMSFEDETL